MIIETYVFDAYRAQSENKLYLTLAPQRVKVDKIVLLPTGEYRVYYDRGLACVPKMDFEKLFIQPYNWVEKLWKKVTS